MLIFMDNENLKCDVSLLNPITRDHISLPPLSPFWVDMDEAPPLMSGANFKHTKPVLTGNPSSSSHEDFLALVVLDQLVFCRLGGDVWTRIDLLIHEGIALVDFAYFNGAFYAVNSNSGITVVNARTLKKTYTALPTPRPKNARENFYLVESSGDLLLLERTSRGSVPVTDVFKLDNSGKKLKWAMIKESIGDRALFVSYNMSSISLSSCDYTRSRGDLICFAGFNYCKDDHKHAVAVIRISDIVAGSRTGQKGYWQDSKRARSVACSLLGLTWIIPSLH